MRFSFCLFFLLVSWLVCPEVVAQRQVTVSGRIKASDGRVMPQVTVSVKGTDQGTYTDADGRYSLSLKSGTYTLSVSFLGYESQEKTIVLAQDMTRDFVMEESSLSLDGVNVYGKSRSQKIREGGFAVNALDVKPIVSSLNNLTTLVDHSAGVRIRQEGGVGSDYDLSINGMSGNSIRYFIDGVPLDIKGSGVSLSNLPVNIIDRVEIYKGVVPASLGTDALGGAINIITRQEQKNYLDVSYSVGSFHTHKADLNAQFVERRTGLVLHPTVGVSYSLNDYMMRDVEVWDEDSRKYVPSDRRRFHDGYFSVLAQLEAGFRNKPWADAFFVSASYSKVDKELQTGSVQSKVYGKAERKSDAWNVSARYRKDHFLLEQLRFSALFSHTWDYSVTVDTAYRKYDWNGNYIESSRNEITGRGRSIRHYDRPFTVVRGNLDYSFNESHGINLNYMLNRTGNNRYDELDTDFEAANDVLGKHIVGFAYHQSLWDGRMENSFFVKDYVNHLNIRQTDLYWQTGSDEVKGSSTKSYLGYGAGLRYNFLQPLAVKASFEHSVRLPLARELLGNGTTVYANVALRPEKSDNVNLGLFGTWHPAGAHTLSYELNGFLRFVDDYIQATVSEKEGMMQYENVPAVNIRGMEGEVRYDFDGRLRLSANISYQDARDKHKLKDDGKPSATYMNRVPNRPWLFSSSEASYTFHDLFLHGSHLRIGMDYQWVHWYFLTWEAYGARESKAKIPTQHICDADITYSWHNGRYNVSVECTNFLDKLAYDNYKLQKPGRAFMAKFRLFID